MHFDKEQGKETPNITPETFDGHHHDHDHHHHDHSREAPEKELDTLQVK